MDAKDVYLERKPAAHLAQSVAMYWYCENYRVAHTKERRLPSNAFQIVIDLAHDHIRQWEREDTDSFTRVAPSLVVGLPSRYSVIDTASLKSMIGVVFQPGWARAFFRLPLGELENLELDLELFWGALARELRERLQEAKNAAAKFCVLDAVLVKQLNGGFESHPVLRYVMDEMAREPETRRIADIAERTGLSGRRLTQLFREQIGLTPKMYCRVFRLQRVLRQVGTRKTEVNWLRVALDCGYYDQAHFVHEFREFAGFTPSEFNRRERPWLNHVAADQGSD